MSALRALRAPPGVAAVAAATVAAVGAVAVGGSARVAATAGAAHVARCKACVWRPPLPGCSVPFLFAAGRDCAGGPCPSFGFVGVGVVGALVT